uniref:leukocyte elastase inhibitor-like n=1 Tax=Styela clava TaxID=7725 RepID=UPI00193A93C3|nr:leukocyte elastase inhibitor-like [Styela clava]
MNYSLLILLIGLVFHCGEASKKKSIVSGTPWPGFPFNRPPMGYFSKSPVEPDEYYEDYDLVEENDLDENEKSTTKPDYKKSNAFHAGIASAIHDFTFDLYKGMVRNKSVEDNLVFSPLSVYTALCMLTLGLGGKSHSQAMEVLHGDAFPDVHNAMSELSDAIFDNSRSGSVTLTKANRIFIDRSVRLLKEFKSSMRKDYHVSAKKVNFMNAPDLNRRRINQFVQRHTERKIKDLAPRGSISSDTRLFIANAMYMKASWETRFTFTDKGRFTVNPSEKIIVDMMQSSSGSCYTTLSNELNAEVIRILMKGDVSFIAIVPSTPGDFSLLEDGRGKGRTRRALEALYEPGFSVWPQLCRITMPKFKIDFKADDLIDVLKDMGMTDIFDPTEADLSKMTPSREPLYVSDVRHKATIDVNENGLEAAAATGIGVAARMMPQPVTIDRPFLFMVRDEKTGATIFTGKVVRPKYE